MPTISVIVPVYKVEPYLRQCVNSVLEQTFGDFELILVDDGSPDNCPAICDEYTVQDARVKVIHKANGGLSDARNVGISVARGAYITFIDSDDVIHPFYLEHLLRGLISHDADICMCWFQKFEKDPVYSIDQPYSEKRLMTGKEACSFIGSSKNRVSTAAWMKLYKTSLFSGIEYPVGRIHEDEATTHKLLYRAKKVVELDEDLYCYRTTPNSIMTAPFSIRRYDAVIALQERYLFFEENHEPELSAKAKQLFELTKAKCAIRARHSGIYEQVSPEYRMPVMKALRVIYKNSDPDNFEWFLSLVYPKLTKPYEYLRKIKTIFKK